MEFERPGRMEIGEHILQLSRVNDSFSFGLNAIDSGSHSIHSIVPELKIESIFDSKS